jgi:methionine-rich copper-binding protein CopC
MRSHTVHLLGRWLPAPVVALLVSLVALAATTGVASAHAAYVSSNPGANAVVRAAPSTITIHFAENVVPASSDIVVLDSKAKVVSTGAAKVDSADLKTMTVSMQGDDSEIYLVQWHTVSADDGDPDVGAFTFTVNPNATPAPTSTGTGTTHTTGSTGVSGWAVALVGVVGLLVGAAGGLAVSRRAAR